MGVNTNQFKEGRTNGHLDVIIPVEDYCTIIGNNMCTYNPPVDIYAYDPAANNSTAAVLAVKEAEWKRKLTALEKFNGACVGAKEIII